MLVQPPDNTEGGDTYLPTTLQPEQEATFTSFIVVFLVAQSFLLLYINRIWKGFMVHSCFSSPTSIIYQNPSFYPQQAHHSSKHQCIYTTWGISYSMNHFIKPRMHTGNQRGDVQSNYMLLKKVLFILQ